MLACIAALDTIGGLLFEQKDWFQENMTNEFLGNSFTHAMIRDYYLLHTF